MCRYCKSVYEENKNCDSAPDCFKKGLEQFSCMVCARCFIYHCMSDAEGETPHHSCECAAIDTGCTKRYILLLKHISLFGDSLFSDAYVLL